MKIWLGFTSSVGVIRCITCLWVCSPWVQVWSGAALTGFLPSLLHLCLSLVTAAQGETGLSDAEWQAKPVLTQHLKPPHKYRLPFPISKQPIHLCLHAYTLLHVMCWGVSLKMTMGHLADLQRVGLWSAALHCSSAQLRQGQILRATQQRWMRSLTLPCYVRDNRDALKQIHHMSHA